MQGKKTKRTCLPIRRHKRHKVHPWVGKIPGRRASSSTEVATHSNILAWRIPRTEEPGGLQSIRLQSQMQLND